MIQSFVQLPDPLVANLTAVIVTVIVLSINFLIVRVPFLAFLANYATEWGYVAAAAFVGWVQNSTPDAYGEIAIHALYIVLAVIGLVTGAKRLLASRGVKGFAV